MQHEKNTLNPYKKSKNNDIEIFVSTDNKHLKEIIF